MFRGFWGVFALWGSFVGESTVAPGTQDPTGRRRDRKKEQGGGEGCRIQE